MCIRDRTSDVHGNFFPYNFIERKEWSGSLARVHSFVKEQREKYGDNCLLDVYKRQVEEYAEVVRIVKEQENLHLTLKCSFVDELKIDQSISHNGVCLTVVSLQDGTYTVTAMKETIERSNIGLLLSLIHIFSRTLRFKKGFIISFRLVWDCRVWLSVMHRDVFGMIRI